MSVRPPARFDPLRFVARALCAVFGLLGALPFVAELVLGLGSVQSWAASETRRVLKEELGLEASYDVRIHLIPLRLRLRDLTVPANDGRGPALRVEEVSVRPRVFSLLAGKLDFGDIEIESPRARLVIQGDRIANVNYRLPERPKSASPTRRAPFSSLSVSEARVSLESGGTSLVSGPMDLDVLAESGPTFEVLLRATESAITHTQPRLRAPPGTPPEVNEDVLCRLELRLRVDGKDLLLRRLSTLGVADLDPAAGSRPSCSAPDDAKGRVALRLSQVRALLRERADPYVSGHVVVRGPLGLVNRFVPLAPLDGWAGFAGDVHYDGKTKLPEVQGRLSGAGIAFGAYRLAQTLSADLDLRSDVVRLPRYEMDFADGHVVARNLSIEPTKAGVPVSVERVDGAGMLFESMMRDLDVTPNTVVRWNLVGTHVTKIQGTLAPLRLDADLAAETRDFEVFDRAFHDPARRHMIGVQSSVLRGRFGVRPGGILFYDTRADFGKSSIYVKMVEVGFSNELEIDIPPGARIDLSDISPIADLTMAGVAELDVKLGGLASDPLLTGNLKVDGLEMAGFPLGDVKSAKVTFKPLWVRFSDVQAKKGQSEFVLPEAKLDFDAGPSLLVEARVTSDSLDLRDFFDMWHFDEDPRFEPIHGKTGVNASVRYVIGGPEDRCRTGVLRTAGKLTAHGLDLFEEHYDGGEADFDFSWTDQAAGYRGIALRVPRIVLQKGSGTLTGRIGLEPGAQVSAEMVASSVPISKLDAVPALLRAGEGTVSAMATFSGTLDALAADVNATMSPVRLSGVTLPGSELSIHLEPIETAPPSLGVSRCGQPISGKFDRAEYDRDIVAGVFRINGSLFGGHVKLNDLRITRQRNKHVRGEVSIDGFDAGAIAALRPDFEAQSRPNGRLSGKIRLEDLELVDPLAATGTFEVSELWMSRGGYRIDLAPGAAPIVFSKRRFEIPRATLDLGLPGAQKATFDLAGSVAGVGGAPIVDAKLVMRPLKLAGLTALVPRIERANGSLSGLLQVQGPLGALRYAGGFELESSELSVRGLSSPISDLALSVKLDGRELTITKGSARIGDGAIALGGGLRLRGVSLDEARVRITAQKLALPANEGVRAVADADLVLAFAPRSDPNERVLPRLTGSVTLRSFEYRRPIAMTADLNILAQRGKRTEFDAYDPSEDLVAFDVAIRSERPLKLQNELIEADLAIADEGLVLAGTNGRFGLRGAVRIKPGGRILLRRNSFEITDGTVKFNDTTRIHPDVDVTAATEYRRYSDAAAASQPGAAATTTTGSSTSATGGRWTVRLHAYGDADNLKVDLTSDPALAQDDIFLLLTVGLTRAELDQAQSASVGESVALEALGTLTGADRAIKDAVPLIDEFRFGSTYSSRTGRTEPTVTIGKRLTQRVRGNVTTGLSESREIRSNLEWQLSPRVSVEGSYDNVNDISSSSLGNLGTDIRWRLEFE